MAKRKRLTPAQPDYFNTTARAPEVKSMPGSATDPATGPASGPGFSAPPIAQVAGEAATRAALDEVSGVLHDARAQGRLIEALPLETIEAHYLVRDRLVQDDDEMATLMASLKARGQQTPIEVTALSASDHAPAYGLITGWRRLNALRRLYEDTNEARFATVKALVVDPASAQDAYVAMVEENEIRVNLSLFERANIARRAAEEGIYPTARHAVLGLFESASRSKRSKILSFVSLVAALDSILRFPTAIPEKLGLGLAKALAKNPDLAKTIRNWLTMVIPMNADEELMVLSRVLDGENSPDKDSYKEDKVLITAGIPRLPPAAELAPASPETPAVPEATPAAALEVVPGLRLRFHRSGRPCIELSGMKVNDALYDALKDWLAATQKG